MAYKDPMLELMASLPQLLLGYRMQQEQLRQSKIEHEEEMALRRDTLNINTEQTKVNQQLELLKYETEFHMQKSEDIRDKTDALMSSMLDIETELSSIGKSGWADKINSLPEIYQTSGGQQKPSDFAGDVMKSFEWLRKENQRMSGEYEKELKSVQARDKALRNEWGKLQNLKESSSKVTAYTSPKGPQDTIDAEDMAHYFDNDLTYDGSEEGMEAFRTNLIKTNPSIDEASINAAWRAYTAGKYDKNNQDYELYKELFVSWDPGEAEDLAMMSSIAEAKALHRQSLDTTISETYASIKGTFDTYQASEDYEGSSAEEIWGAILSRSGTNENWDALSDEAKIGITTWLNESLVEAGSAKDWYDKLQNTEEGRLALDWLSTDDQFSYRIERMNQAVLDYNDPFKGQGTAIEQVTSDQFMNILDDHSDPAEIYKAFNGTALTLGDKSLAFEGFDAMVARAAVLADDPDYIKQHNLSERDRERLRNLDPILNDYILKDKGELESSLRVWDDELTSLEIQLKEALVNDDQVKIQSLEEKIEDTKTKKRNIQTGAMAGFESKEQILFDLSRKEDILPSGQTVLDILEQLEDPSLLPQKKYDSKFRTGVYTDPKKDYNYTMTGRYDPHDITDIKSSSQVKLKGDRNPYVDAYDAKAEEIWNEVDIELEAASPWGLDPIGPDILTYGDKHPLNKLQYAHGQGVISNDDYKKYVAQMEEAGDTALASRLNEILDDPTAHKEDYRDLLNVINRSQEQGRLQEALDNL